MSDYSDFLDDIELTAQSEGLLKSEAFFRLFTEAALESGDIEDVEYCPVLSEARPAYRIDGYYLNTDQGELGLLICDYRSESEIQVLNASDCKAHFGRVERFFTNALDTNFVSSLEDASPAFQAAYLINSSLPQIRRVRIIILSNARLAIRKELVSTRTEGKLRITYNILDFQRYVGIQSSRTGVDPIEINLREGGLAPLPCLSASSDKGHYAAYLVVVPATILAEIYGLYGARLLEANVRTFLQARTKVNKGMQLTLKDEPQNFFAYNNGLTATASAVDVEQENETKLITRISDLQIVNGGQTTASILYARDKEKRDLGDVFVQMKLSVVDAASIEELVPKISRYANSQNVISDADFFASHPFHQQIERLSRRIAAPARSGGHVATKWFYERARGQYNDSMSSLSAAQRRKHQLEYPKEQRLVKTDLAKYELTFECEPHVVSKGAQKCFLEFAHRIDKKWDGAALNFGDGYFKDAMARALVFRWTDKMVGGSAWYHSDRAYKAQIVTYTIALLVHILTSRGLCLDFRKIWNHQEVPGALQKCLEALAPRVAAVITNPPANVRNVGEYCKNQLCWKQLLTALGSDTSIATPGDAVLDLAGAAVQREDDRSDRRIDSGIDAQARVVELGGPYWREVLAFCRQERIGSPTEINILSTCAAIPNRVPSEKQAAVALRILERAQGEGFKL